MTASALTRSGERDRLVVKAGQIDWLLVGLLGLIAGVGAVVLFSIAPSSWEPWAGKHVLRFGLCVGLMLALALVDLRVWFHLAYPAYAVSLLLLVAVALFGDVALNARRWLDLGFVRLQPSEFMKVALVLALARFYHGLSADQARWSWKLLVPAALILVPFELIRRQPDLGTAMLVLMTGGAMVVLAGLSVRVITALAAAAAAAAGPMVMFVLSPEQRERILTLFNPGADPMGAGYQIIQSKIALGSGGLLGRGYGEGSQSRLDFLPEKQTDFIFAALAEEFGLVACVSVLLLYGLAVFTALRIAATSHSHFARLMVGGVTATFALYVLINGAMVMGLAPVVGVPMPLLSYGGTVMLTVMVGFGLVQSARVHRYSEITRGKGTLI